MLHRAKLKQAIMISSMSFELHTRHALTSDRLPADSPLFKLASARLLKQLGGLRRLIALTPSHHLMTLSMTIQCISRSCKALFVYNYHDYTSITPELPMFVFILTTPRCSCDSESCQIFPFWDKENVKLTTRGGDALRWNIRVCPIVRQPKNDTTQKIGKQNGAGTATIEANIREQ